MNHLCFDASGPREVESLRNFVLEEAEKAARTKLEADRDLWYFTWQLESSKITGTEYNPLSSRQTCLSVPSNFGIVFYLFLLNLKRKINPNNLSWSSAKLILWRPIIVSKRAKYLFSEALVCWCLNYGRKILQLVCLCSVRVLLKLFSTIMCYIQIFSALYLLFVLVIIYLSEVWSLYVAKCMTLLAICLIGNV